MWRYHINDFGDLYINLYRDVGKVTIYQSDEI